MSKMNLAVEISFNKKGNGAEAAIRDVRLLGDESKRSTGAADGLTMSMGRLAAGLGVIAGAMKGFDILKTMVTQGLAFNAQMETSRLGLAALIGAFGQVKDASGNAMNDLTSRLEVAGELQRRLKLAALQTTASYGEMVQALQVGLGPALKAGFNTEQIVTFTKTVTQAAGAIGLPMNQLGQEIRSLFAGDIGPDSRLANLLFSDIPRNKIKAYVSELQTSGKFFEELQKRMASFAEAGEKAGDTMLGAWSNLKDAFEQALGEGTQGQFKGLTELVKDLTEKIVTFDDAGQATFNQDFVNGIEAITGAFTRLASSVVGYLQKLDDLTVKWRALKAIADDVAGLAPGATDAARKAVSGETLVDNDSVYGSAVGSALKTIVDPMAIPKAINGWTWEKVSGLFDTKVAEIKAADAQLQASAESALRSLGKSVADRVGGSALGARQAAEVWSGGRYAFGEGLTPDAFYEELGAFTKDRGADLPALIKAINAAAKDGVLTLKELNAARTLKLESGGGGGGETDEQRQKREAAAKRIATETQKEYDTLAKIGDQSEKNVSLGLLHLNVIKAETDEQRHLADFILKSKEIELREHEKIDSVMKLTHVSEIARQTALAHVKESFQNEQEQASAAFQKQQDETAKKTHADMVKQIDDALAGYDAMIAKSQDLTRSVNEATVQAFRDALKKAREPFEEFFRSVGDGMKRAMASALDGGGIRGAFDSFFKSVFDTVGANFAKAIDEWMEKLSLAAAGQEKVQTGTDAGGQPIYSIRKREGGPSKGAQLGMLGLQGASAAYGLYTNPAPKQGQNILSGAMSGASIGFSYGSMTGNPYAMIIGAVVGAIVGAFAPTEKGKNVKIYSNNGQVTVTGMDSGWGTEKLLKSINSAVRGTAAKLDEIFLSLPTAALAALGNWRPDLSKIDVSGKADGKNWNEELDNYLKETLPARVFGAYSGAISGALKFAGVTDKKLNEFTAYLKGLTTDEAIKAVSDYMGVMYGFFELYERYFGGISKGKQRSAGRSAFDPGATFERSVYANADRGPLGEFGDQYGRMAVYKADFDKATNHEDQVKSAQRLLELSNQFFQGMEQYLLHLRDMQDGMNASVDAQIRDINYDQIKDPKQKAEFLMAEQRALYDQLSKAGSAEEVNRIMADIQRNAGVLYTLLGSTPDAAKTAKDQLEDARKLANDRYKIFHDNAQKMIDDAFKLVDDILKRLRDGLPESRTKLPNGPDDLPGGGGDTGETDDRRRLRLLGLAAEESTGNLNAFTPSIADATAKVLSFSAALAANTQTPPPVNVTVNLPPTSVEVQMTGDMSQYFNTAVATAANAAVTKAYTASGRLASRAAMSGR